MAATTNLMSLNTQPVGQTTSSTSTRTINTSPKYKNSSSSFDRVFDRMNDNSTSYATSDADKLPSDSMQETKKDPITAAITSSAHGKSKNTQDAPQKQKESQSVENEAEIEDVEDDIRPKTTNIMNLWSLVSLNTEEQNVDIIDTNIQEDSKVNLMTILPQSEESNDKSQDMLNLLSGRTWKINKQNQPVNQVNQVNQANPVSYSNADAGVQIVEIAASVDVKISTAPIEKENLQSQQQPQQIGKNLPISPVDLPVQEDTLDNISNFNVKTPEILTNDTKVENFANINVDKVVDVDKKDNFDLPALKTESSNVTTEINDTVVDLPNQSSKSPQPIQTQAPIQNVGDGQLLTTNEENESNPLNPQFQQVNRIPQQFNYLSQQNQFQPLVQESNSLRQMQVPVPVQDENENVDQISINESLSDVIVDEQDQPMQSNEQPQQQILSNNQPQQGSQIQQPLITRQGNDSPQVLQKPIQGAIEDQSPVTQQSAPAIKDEPIQPIHQQQPQRVTYQPQQVQQPQIQDQSAIPENRFSQQPQPMTQPFVTERPVVTTNVEPELMNQSIQQSQPQIQVQPQQVNYQPQQQPQPTVQMQAEMVEMPQVQATISENQLESNRQQTNPVISSNLFNAELEVDGSQIVTPSNPSQQQSTQQQSQNPQQNLQSEIQQTTPNDVESKETTSSQTPTESFVAHLGAATNNLNSNQINYIPNDPVNQTAQTARQDFNITGQIVEHAKMIRTLDNTEMVIHLKPEHLGELTLRVSVTSNGAVNASFHSDNAQVRAMIENSLVQLKQELSNQGLKVDSVQVYAGLSDGGMMNGKGQQAWQQNQQGNNNSRPGRIDFNKLSAAEEAAEIVSTTPENSVTSEGVDYRV